MQRRNGGAGGPVARLRNKVAPLNLAATAMDAVVWAVLGGEWAEERGQTSRFNLLSPRPTRVGAGD